MTPKTRIVEDNHGYTVKTFLGNPIDGGLLRLSGLPHGTPTRNLKLPDAQALQRKIEIGLGEMDQLGRRGR